MANRVTSVGLHIAATEFYQDIWLDTTRVQYRANNREIGLISTSTSGVFLHKTDAGRRDCLWEHSNVYFPVNFGGATGTVTVSYLYSNIEYDIQDSGERTTLIGLLSPPKTQAQLRTELDGVGRYRYWYVTLTSASGAENPFVAEWGAVQELSQPVEYGSVVVLATDSSDPRPTRKITVVRKTTPSISLIYSTTVDLLSRYDISGATITLRVARTPAIGTAGTYLIPAVSVGVDDGPMGEASVQLTELQTTLTAGLYSCDIELVKGGTKLRHVLPFEVTDALV